MCPLPGQNACPVSIEERDRSIEKYQSLVTPIAQRFQFEYRLRPEDAEDLAGAGLIDLINAASKKGEALSEQYANTAIKNAVSRECFNILASHGRRRVKHPVTGKLVWPDEYLADIREKEAVEQPDCCVEEASDRQCEYSPRSANQRSDNLDCMIVKEGLARLNPQEAEIVHLRHRLGLTVRETSSRAGIEKSKVSRIEKSARQKLEYLR